MATKQGKRERSAVLSHANASSQNPLVSEATTC